MDGSPGAGSSPPRPPAMRAHRPRAVSHSPPRGTHHVAPDDAAPAGRPRSPSPPLPDRPQPRSRRASIMVATLSSLHRPEFPRAGPSVSGYGASNADDIIRNQDVYYRWRPDVRFPLQRVPNHDFSRADRTSAPAPPPAMLSTVSPTSLPPLRTIFDSGTAGSDTELTPARSCTPMSPLATSSIASAPADSTEDTSSTTAAPSSSSASVTVVTPEPQRRPSSLQRLPSRRGPDSGVPVISQSRKSSVADNASLSGSTTQTDNSASAPVKYNFTLSAEWSHVVAIMKSMRGIIRGFVKWQTESTTGRGLCYIEEFSGSLISIQNELTKVLIHDLRGCTVSLSPLSPTAIQVISAKDPSNYAIIDPENAENFSRWIAVLLSWSPLRAAGVSSRVLRFKYPRLDLFQLRPGSSSSSSAAASPASKTQTPITVRTIKVGQLELWDPSARRPNNSSSKKSKLGSSSLSQPTQYWAKASCLLRTNGDMQIFPENNASTFDTPSDQRVNPAHSPSSPHGSSPSFSTSKSNHLTLKLSTIRRSAIQRADPSLTGRQHCIVVFLKSLPPKPNAANNNSNNNNHASQSTAEVFSNTQLTPTSPTLASGGAGVSVHHSHQYHHHQPPLLGATVAPTPRVTVNPMYLSFDSETTFNVWFVLLRSLSLPELYGADVGQVDGSFRQQRRLTLRIIEAKIMFPHRPAMNTDSSLLSRGVDSYIDIELNEKVRARTRVKTATTKPFWREDFDFPDLPFLVNAVKLVLRQRSRKSSDLTTDTSIGEVRFNMSDILKDSDLERWVPIYNSSRGYLGKTGEICAKMHLSELTILAGKEYKRLLELLLDFGSKLTIEIADITNDTKRLPNILLDVFQSMGQATEWIIALAEDEIWETGSLNGLKKSTRIKSPEPPAQEPLPSSELIVTRPVNVVQSPPFPSSVGSGSSGDSRGVLSGHSSGRSTLSAGTLSPMSLKGSSENLASHTTSPGLQEINNAAIADANLLFRGNSLLTKSLDAHMRRVGHMYIVETIGDIVSRIVKEDVLCEVDPQRLDDATELDQNWTRLNRYIAALWQRIRESAPKCPPGLRRIFANIRMHIEEKYGEFIESASYTGVSGFLFLRFFCPAVLNPNLFGLVNDHPRSRAQRTLVLLAKGLQGLANRSQFGMKEQWMEPMNKFLNAHSDEIKEFIKEVSTWRTRPLSQGVANSKDDFQDDNELEASRRSLAMVPYQIPSTVLAHLPPAFRDSAPTLPYLIDKPAVVAELVDLWLEWYDTACAEHEAKRASRSRSRRRGGAEDELSETLSHLNRRMSSASSHLTRGMPDAYTDSSDTPSDESSEEDDDVDSEEDDTEPLAAGPSWSRARKIAALDDMPSGIKFSDTVNAFHDECLRIRDVIQRLLHKSSIPEIPSEVPEETWDYYVANFLDRSAFRFERRGGVLKSLLMSMSDGSQRTMSEESSAPSTEDGVSARRESATNEDNQLEGNVNFSEAAERRDSFERGEERFNYFYNGESSDPGLVIPPMPPMPTASQRESSHLKRFLTTSSPVHHLTQLHRLHSAKEPSVGTIGSATTAATTMSSSVTSSKDMGSPPLEPRGSHSTTGTTSGGTNTSPTIAATMPVSFDALPANGTSGSSTDSSRSGFTSMSKGFGSLSKKSKSLKLHSLRRLLGGSISSSASSGSGSATSGGAAASNNSKQ
ncbi:uncharacterized protein V1518DRAFT_420513 [Limtongia smithiae]|uniref:uncharacterized protein n=1 Tax=Limtongia smithiae TaxID=1125753 RepID=UPI0034CFD1F0